MPTWTRWTRALGELRAAGWAAPEHPDSGKDAELGGRDHIAGRLSDEVSWLRQCADWLVHLDTDSSPPTVSLRPAAGWLDRAIVAVDLARVRTVTGRIAAEVDELARTWSSGPSAPGGGCPLPQPRSWSEPGTPGRPSGTSAARSASGPATPTTGSGHANDHPVPQRTPGQFRKLDAVAVRTGPSSPAPYPSAAYAVARPCRKRASGGHAKRGRSPLRAVGSLCGHSGFCG
jgi:hypothetical protein